jgi:hypothetical protein
VLASVKGAGGLVSSYKPQLAIIQSSLGRSFGPVAVDSIVLKTSSKPSMTLPKTTCFPSK